MWRRNVACGERYNAWREGVGCTGWVAWDVSTPELIRRIAKALGTKARLVPVPPNVLRIAGGLIGRKAELSCLLGSLQVDIEHTRQTLDWARPVTVEQGLQRAVANA